MQIKSITETSSQRCRPQIICSVETNKRGGYQIWLALQVKLIENISLRGATHYFQNDSGQKWNQGNLQNWLLLAKWSP